MTNWDNIYKNYQKGKAENLNLPNLFFTQSSDKLIPSFIDFIRTNHFNYKNVLDIGCGAGTYLKFLKELGFKISGIDSSKIAVEMAQKLLGEDSDIVCIDMFDLNIPQNKYDLIYSISTIHHGLKGQVIGLINKIYDSLLPGGKIFITLLKMETSDKQEAFKNYKELALGTYAPILGPEKGLVHSFFTEEEVKNIFFKFRDLKIELDEPGGWIVLASK